MYVIKTERIRHNYDKSGKNIWGVRMEPNNINEFVNDMLEEPIL